MNAATYHTRLLSALKEGIVTRKTLLSGPYLGCEALYLGDHRLAGRTDFEPDWESGEVLVEELQTDVELVICGGGHIALEIAMFCERLGYRTTIIDEREAYCNNERFAGSTCLCGPFADILGCEQNWVRPFFVIATRGHMFDQLCLETILGLPHRYIGMIGSKAKVAATFENLKQKGFSQAQLDQVHAPIGLPIGAVTAGEIAISILAQIIQTARSTLQGVQLEQKTLRRIAQTEQKCILVRVIDKSGSAPCEIGFQLIVQKDGQVVGTVGGGAIEAKAIEEARNMLKADTTTDQVLAYDLSNAKAGDLGMICGGSVRLLFQLW